MKKIYLVIQLFVLLHFNESYSQISWTTNVYPGGLNYVGWDNSASVAPDIRNNSNPVQPIEFYINNVKFLQVLTGGDLNVVRPGDGYMINGNYVLWNNNTATNIFVGMNSGGANVSGVNNTFTGYNTGTNVANSGVSFPKSRPVKIRENKNQFLILMAYEKNKIYRITDC